MQLKAPRGPGYVLSLTPETGSSVAIALGVGLAALIIYCARVNQIYGSLKLNDEDIAKLLKAENMVKAMSSFGLSASKGTENKFTEVWNKLEDTTKRLTTAKGAKAREIVAELAKDLISPSTLR
ncbi:hypothetical protein GQ607_016314 [Colletotrichum asianum]|uniref:Uncharacterized protein n=1 Tax=Colletotrichum asianum TaxID=702518 RepID=A0A8H3ZLX7_9PEZI|nr:hypothetical protein GQ607_016314 [Colletotrichum asianum]